MSTHPLALCFYGQGPIWNVAWLGVLTSLGIYQTAKRLRNELGYDARCYNFNLEQLQQATLDLDQVRKGDPTIPCIGVGYSLGNTPLLQLQNYRHLDLVFSIADSKLAGANNAPINHHLTDRAVLWRDPASILSGAGGDLGYDAVHDIRRAHLLMDFASPVIDNLMMEAKLAKER